MKFEVPIKFLCGNSEVPGSMYEGGKMKVLGKFWLSNVLGSMLRESGPLEEFLQC